MNENGLKSPKMNGIIKIEITQNDSKLTKIEAQTKIKIDQNESSKGTGMNKD